jgi:hypothetical protein
MYFLNFLQARVFSFFPLFLVSDLILPILCKLNGRQSRFVRGGALKETTHPYFLLWKLS